MAGAKAWTGRGDWQSAAQQRPVPSGMASAGHSQLLFLGPRLLLCGGGGGRASALRQGQGGGTRSSAVGSIDFTLQSSISNEICGKKILRLVDELGSAQQELCLFTREKTREEAEGTAAFRRGPTTSL